MRRARRAHGLLLTLCLGTRCLGTLCLGTLCLGLASTALAGIPEPDLVFYGELGPVEPNDVRARFANAGAESGASEVLATSPREGLYALRVPVARAGRSGRRRSAVTLGERVELHVRGVVVMDLIVDRGGLLVRHDIDAVPTGGGFRRGDADASGTLGITDAVTVLGHLFRGGRAPSCADAADANDDGRVDISDAVGILGFLFLAGAPLPAPGPFECGEDRTADELGSCAQASCRGANGAGAGAGELADGGGESAGDGAVAGALADTSDDASAGDVTSAGRGAARADELTEEERAHAMLALELHPETLRFGAVAVGEESQKTLMIRNPGAFDLTLSLEVDGSTETPQLDRGGELERVFEPLTRELVVRAGSSVELAVLFAPSAPGVATGRLLVGPGRELALAGHGLVEAPAVALANARVEPADWHEGSVFEIPFTTRGVSAERVRIVAREIADAAAFSIESVTASASGRTGTVRVRPAATAEGSTPRVLSLSSETVRVLVDGKDLGALVPLGAGEIVVAPAPLDLDRDRRVLVASDLVLAERALAGEPAQPSRFAGLLETLPASLAELEARAIRLSDVAPWLASGSASGANGALLTALGAALVDAECSPALEGIEAARSEWLSRRALRPAGFDDTRDSVDPLGVTHLELARFDDRESGDALAVLVDVERSVSTLVLTLELEHAELALRSLDAAAVDRVAADAFAVEVQCARVRGAARQWRVVVRDPRGEAWIDAPGGVVARLVAERPSERGKASGTKAGGASDAPATTSVRLVYAEAFAGPRALALAVEMPGLATSIRTRAASPPLEGEGCEDKPARLEDALALARVLLGAADDVPRRVVACDANRDGRVDFGDVVALLERALGGAR